jgi:hypothetical protein
MPFGNLFSELFSDLKNSKTLSKYKLSDLEFFGIHLIVFLKNPRIFFKNGQKFVLVRLGTS